MTYITQICSTLVKPAKLAVNASANTFVRPGAISKMALKLTSFTELLQDMDGNIYASFQSNTFLALSLEPKSAELNSAWPLSHGRRSGRGSCRHSRRRAFASKGSQAYVGIVVRLHLPSGRLPVHKTHQPLLARGSTFRAICQERSVFFLARSVQVGFCLRI